MVTTVAGISSVTNMLHKLYVHWGEVIHLNSDVPHLIPHCDPIKTERNPPSVQAKMVQLPKQLSYTPG